MEQITDADFNQLGPWVKTATYGFVGDTGKLPRDILMRLCVPYQVERLGTCVKR
jgi:hypothetical protein